MNLFRDENGWPRADVPEAPPLGWFLEQDVQGDASFAGELADAIARVDRGEVDSWSCTGNAHTLELRPGLARISTELAEPPAACVLPSDELLAALHEWVRFVGVGW